MKIVLYAKEGDKSHRGIWHNYFADGLKKHNVDFSFETQRNLIDCDIAVVWNIRDKKIFEYQSNHNAHTLVFERGFTGKRSDITMVGYNNLNGRADYCNKNMSGDKWKRYYAGRIKPWNPEGEYVLITGQINGDASLHGVNINNWVKSVMNIYDSRGVKYKYRPHPGHGIVFEDSNPELDVDIANASHVVTYNSASGIESILAGKPTIAIDEGSMVWDIAKHDILDFSIIEPKRKNWAYDFAYTQWNKEDMISGECWEHLKNGPNDCFI